MAEPSPAERALLELYRAAEAALLREATGALTYLVDGERRGEAARRADALNTVRKATARIVRRLDVVTPGLLTDTLAAAAQDGEAQAAAWLRDVAGGNHDTDQGIARGVLDRLAVALTARTEEAHAAILRTTPDRFRDVVSRAVVPALVGTETGRHAAQRAWWELTDAGIASFTDAGGRQWRLSSYVEMATRTATARAMVDAKHDALAADGEDLVIVQGSNDRCERCRPWHGRILSITGMNVGDVEVEHALRDETVLVHVAASVAAARAAGWGHPQCRCGTDAYLPGLTRVPAAAEREDVDEQYAARQRQRAIERQIRRGKERETAALDEPAQRRARAQTRAAQARMREHLEDNPDLIRRSYREQPGAGQVPTAERAAALAVERGQKGPKLPRPTPVRKLRDGEVEDRMNDAVVRLDDAAMDVYGAELDRRDQAKSDRAARDLARAVEREEAQGRHLEELLAQGVPEEDAVADAYGITVETQRRQAAMASLRADNYVGRSFDELARAAYRDDVVRRYGEAEDGTNGYMVTREGLAAGVTALSLFTGPESRVRRYASPELREWFDQHGRPTLDEYKAELLDPTSARRMREQRGDFYT